MDVKELRLGNLIQDRKNRVCIVKSLHLKCIQARTIGSSTFERVDDGEPFKPIPLTNEWLDWLGFEYKEMYYQSKYLVALNDCFMIIQRVDGFFYVDAPNNELKHVHQLQNLYFALTGEELTIFEQ